MRVIFTCGGTGGHINPAIAVAKFIRQRRPDAQILFVGAAGGMETKLVPQEGFEIRTVEAHNLSRSLKPAAMAKNIGTLVKMVGCLKQAQAILEAFKPDVVVGTGGYASYPVIRQAAKLGIPTAIHESNAVPGLTTRMLSRKADLIMVGFEEGIARYNAPEKVVLTGTPVREGFLFTTRQNARRELKLDGRPLIVSYWGSLGAREMNKKTAKLIALEAKDRAWHHIHATGSFGFKWMPGLISDMGVDLSQVPEIDLREYIFDMLRVMAAADLVLCRAGASTLTELTAAAKPAVIIPSPNVTGDHQRKNARAYERYGAALVIDEGDCDGQTLFDTVKSLLADPKRLKAMADRAGQTAVLDATQRIYDAITGLISR